MAASPLILAIDQGTTSTRALLFDGAGGVQATAQVALPQIFPRDGWVEHDPEIIWRDTVQVCRDVLAAAGDRAVAAAGITNQRETGRSTTPLSGRTGAAPHCASAWWRMAMRR